MLSAEEIVRFLEVVPESRNRVALTTAYGTGLRVSEVAQLETTSIDSSLLCQIASKSVPHFAHNCDPFGPCGGGAGSCAFDKV